jgi:hypothetical protein
MPIVGRGISRKKEENGKSEQEEINEERERERESVCVCVCVIRGGGCTAASHDEGTVQTEAKQL